MALEPRLSSAFEPQVDGRATCGFSSTVAEGVGEDGTKIGRLPRWTRQEILVLIQGKRDAENRYKRGRTSSSPLGSVQAESKWASVSTYCKNHGVNRGPVQCRKRWSNLSGDFKKIKDWESHIKDDSESFWVMRNDLRREKKLPGFFDKEVFNILDAGSGFQSPPLALAFAPVEAEAEADGDAERAVFDSGRSATAEDRLFSDIDLEDTGVPITPETEATACGGGGGFVASGSPFTKTKMATTTLEPCSDRIPVSGCGNVHGKQPACNPETGTSSESRKKRKQYKTDGEDDFLQNHLVDVFERNAKILTAQLEAQNTNFKLDCELRKDHADSLVAVLNKLADALGRIADKM